MAMLRIRVDAAASGRDAEALWPVYDAVFGDLADREEWLASVWRPHSAREGFRLARAFDDDELVGFAYGYTGRTGQWWTDAVRGTLDPDVAQAWLDGHFELVSIGVLPEARGRGAGRDLLRALLEGLPHDRLLLMTTADADDPARRLYAAEGWDLLGPGIGDGTVVLGRRSSPQGQL